MNTNRPRSREEFHRAAAVIPGGVNSPARAFGAVGGTPVVMASAQGAVLTDIDSHQYIDYIGSWGPMILGHSHPKVVARVQQAVSQAMSFGAPTAAETLMAESIVSAVPSITKVRMVNSGTEATMSALRVARGATGRDLIIKFAGCYHGHVDSLLVQAGSGALTLGHPSSPGVPAGAVKDTIVLSYNDLDAVRAAFRDHPHKIAAVVLEPVVGNMGLVPPLPGFLEGLRELTAADGSLLFFDEVMTGFRLAYGGAQELLGVTPDMTALGKIVGGGMPVGAYGGTEAVMNCVSPVGPVYQAGTLSGNPVAMAAGLATLEELLANPPYARLEALTARLADGLDKAATDAGIAHHVARVGSMITLFFCEGPVRNLQDAMRSDTKRFARFFHALLDHGVYWPCSQFEAAFVSAAHTNDHIDQTIAIAARAMVESNG